MEYKTISPKEVKAYLRRSDVQVIDLREKESYDELHLKGAISIPYEELDSSMGKLDRGKVIFLYCERGSISLRAAGKLAAAGYRTVTLVGGIFALRHHNFE